MPDQRQRPAWPGVLRHTLVSLALGLVLTVLIAWGCSWWSLGERSGAHFGFSGDPWIRDVPEDWPDSNGLTMLVPRIVAPAGGGIGVRGGRIRERQGMHHGIMMGGGAGGHSFVNDDPTYAVDVVEAGWPWKTMSHVGPTDTRPGLGAVDRGIPVPGVEVLWLKEGRRLPLVPLGMAFAWSVLAWGGAAWLVWQGWRTPRRVRRWKRLRTGRCLACGYELAGLERCPECDTPSESAGS